MDFLLNYGISKETIDLIIKGNDPFFIENFIYEKDLVIKNIIYLRTIGVKVVSELLVLRTDLFLTPENDLKQKFKRFDTNKVAELINNDINVLSFFDKF